MRARNKDGRPLLLPDFRKGKVNVGFRNRTHKRGEAQVTAQVENRIKPNRLLVNQIHSSQPTPPLVRFPKNQQIYTTNNKNVTQSVNQKEGKNKNTKEEEDSEP